MSLLEEFTVRQEMIRPDFEYFHSVSREPVQVPYHSHDFYEVLIFLSGKVHYSVEGRAYHLHPGNVLIVGNRELHAPRIYSGQTYERIVLWLQPAYVRALGGGEDLAMCFEISTRRHYSLLCPQEEAQRTLLELCEQLEQVYGSDAYGSESLRRAFCTQLLVWLNRAYFSAPAETELALEYNEKMADILHYMNLHLQEPLTLDTLSARFYMSKYYLARQFKRYVGLSIHQYILQKRLIRARLALQQGKTPGEAFVQSGFADYTNFSRAFHHQYGISPRQAVNSVPGEGSFCRKEKPE